MKDSKVCSILSSLLIALFFLSVSIAVPILWRGWYYHEAEVLSLAEQTGFSTETIHDAFNAVMDYLVGNAPFSTGVLPFSESGMQHFADCRVLFHLDFFFAEASGLVLLILAVLRWRGVFLPHDFYGFSPSCWAFAGMLILFLLFGIWAAVDFNSLFTLFHMLFFPGKSNWIFNADTDPVILLLPETFWAHTAALTAILTLTGMGLTALFSTVWKRRNMPKNIYEAARRL